VFEKLVPYLSSGKEVTRHLLSLPHETQLFSISEEVISHLSTSGQKWSLFSIHCVKLFYSEMLDDGQSRRTEWHYMQQHEESKTMFKKKLMAD